jgi:FIMAH domain
MTRGLVAVLGLVAACALMLPAAASSQGTFTLSAFGTAAIDGQLSAGEWPATGVTIPLLLGGSATIYAMNDGTTLYLAAQLPTDAPESVEFRFDNDHDGNQPGSEVGDDGLLWVDGGICPAGCDTHSTATGGGIDTGFGGTNDLTFATSASAGTRTVEFAHPLDSADDAHDFSLAAGDTVGVWALVRSGVRIGDALGDITIASPPTSTQLTALRELVASLGIHHGIAKALDSKLRAALAALEADDTAGTCTALQDFRNLVKAQTGKKLSAGQAEDLTDAAIHIGEQICFD